MHDSKFPGMGGIRSISHQVVLQQIAGDWSERDLKAQIHKYSNGSPLKFPLVAVGSSKTRWLNSFCNIEGFLQPLKTWSEYSTTRCVNGGSPAISTSGGSFASPGGQWLSRGGGFHRFHQHPFISAMHPVGLKFQWLEIEGLEDARADHQYRDGHLGRILEDFLVWELDSHRCKEKRSTSMESVKPEGVLLQKQATWLACQVLLENEILEVSRICHTNVGTFHSWQPKELLLRCWMTTAACAPCLVFQSFNQWLGSLGEVFLRDGWNFLGRMLSCSPDVYTTGSYNKRQRYSNSKGLQGSCCQIYAYTIWFYLNHDRFLESSYLNQQIACTIYRKAAWDSQIARQNRDLGFKRVVST